MAKEKNPYATNAGGKIGALHSCTGEKKNSVKTQGNDLRVKKG